MHYEVEKADQFALEAKTFWERDRKPIVRTP